MNLPEAQEKMDVPISAAPNPHSGKNLKRFGLFVAGLIILFIQPLFGLVRFALNSELYSYVLLIPCISIYLVWTNRKNLKLNGTGNLRAAAAPALLGFALLGGYFIGVQSGWKPLPVDYLAMMILAFVSFFVAGCFALLGTALVRSIAFPLALLVFLAPFPEFVRNGIETFLQHASAEAAYIMLKLAGMPVFRQDLVFKLPGFSMHVAPECSGIRSSLILFITSLLAANLFLKGTWSRIIIVCSVVILGILRNGFRIFVLGELCVRVDPNIINSPLHHRGGPIFFALSLVPLFLLLLFLRKRERRAIKSPADIPLQK